MENLKLRQKQGMLPRSLAMLLSLRVWVLRWIMPMDNGVN